MGTFIVGMTMILSGDFIERWMGVEHLQAVSILHVLLCGIFFSLIQIPTLCMLFAISKHKFYAVSNSIHAFVSIGLCLLLVVPYKLAGVAMAITIVTATIKLFVQPRGVLPLLKMKLTYYHLKHTLPNTVIAMLFVVGYYYVVRGFSQPTYLIIFSIAAVGTLFFVPYIFVCGFNSKERTMLFKVIGPSLMLVWGK